MKLIPAGGSPRMQKAFAHPYVHSIVAIVLEHRYLLEDVADLLRAYERRAQPGFAEDLEAIRTVESAVAPSGDSITSSPIIELTQTLYSMYQQPSEDIRYQRGAIVELLIYELVRPRYKVGECVSNHRFIDGKYASDQIDVAALSLDLRHIEGYECKLKIDGVESSDCTNLIYLAKIAQEQQYQVHVGIVCFEDNRSMKRKFKRLQDLAEGIALYGLDTIETLEMSPF